ncbi:MAG TPA: DNA polymerase III subunit gamma/tau [Alphaproteobacteria bacterium]|jgi:DNA polymerase-3 subunit gamma/tau
MNELFPTEPASPYRVLARKYRPVTFAELVGQDALVRTLTNAIRTGRIAHAFVLTGVRGIGKTTTARIIARALNCVGPDGKGGPTIEPCGVCEHCTAIAQDRHVDVIEMDAASRTGVDDIRDLIEGVQYRPVRARYKVYIIDEVHMLSKNAFNALLKTLEEPPEHVKFVFATTEIRKVPITVLSRCQRFDLRRLDREQLAAHLISIAAKEKAKIAPDAIALLARAADGSVRDGLSLLDRAIAESDPAAEISAEQVRGMLGLADRSQTLDLFETVMKGAVAEALALARDFYRAGADPLTLVQDLLEVTHGITRLKLVAEQAAADLSASEAQRAKPLAEKLSVPVLSRAWQMLLKGVNEVQFAPQPMNALEMLLVRLAYVADLPTPGEIVARLQSEGAGNGAGAASGGAAAAAPAPRATAAPIPPTSGRASGNGGPRAALAQQPRAESTPAAAPSAAPAPRAELKSFAELVQLFSERKEASLYADLRMHVHLVRFELGRLEFRPLDRAPSNLPNRVGELLTAWTGQRWMVSVSNEPGEPTLHEQEAARKADAHARALVHPIVKKALAVFPGAAVKVRPLDADTLAAGAPAEEPAESANGEAAPPPAEDYPADYAGPEDEDFA